MEFQVKRIISSLLVAVLTIGLVAGEAEARRLGGGATSGLKRTTPAPRTPDAPPAQPAQPTQAAPTQNMPPAAAAAPAPRRSWLGPLAGLAAGFGLAALMSHLGLGAEFGSLLTMLLLAGIAFIAVRFLVNRMRGNAPAPNRGLQFAGAGGPPSTAWGSGSAALLPGAAAAAAPPPNFDAAGFERVAKTIFIRMQAANDAADLDDLRQFSTPEMFANFRLDIQERGNTRQRTDVVRLDAQVLDVAEEPTRQIVSVRFHGLIREADDTPAVPFDEVWHLVRPTDGSREWAIAGIAQS
jgi:predicted lipid-binding transport protein (Tim44 family)